MEEKLRKDLGVALDYFFNSNPGHSEAFIEFVNERGQIFTDHRTRENHEVEEYRRGYLMTTPYQVVRHFPAESITLRIYASKGAAYDALKEEWNKKVI